MERYTVIVAGFGFRSTVSLAALTEALDKAGGSRGVTSLATLAEKAEALEPLARALGLPLVTVEREALTGVPTLTQSDRVDAMFGTGSIAEAVALVVAGAEARLRGPRAVSADGTATAAIAEGPG